MSHARDDALLAQAEIALETLRFREQAALYRAAAQMLQAALRQAEGGNREPLENWFRNHRDLIDLPTHPVDTSSVSCFAPELEIAPLAGVPPRQSPWAAMEAAIRQREETEHFRSVPVEVVKGDQEEIEIAGIAVGEVAGSTANANEHEPALPSTITEPAEKQNAREAALFEMRREGLDSRRSKPVWWRASHVWISAGVHAVAILLLSLVVIQQISQPQVLAIVSATIESQEVLVETPMESSSELKAEPLEAPAVDSAFLDPNIPDLPDPTVAEVDLTGPILSQQQSSQEVSKALQARTVSAPGKKLAPGAEFFGVKATGNTFVYIVDCSPSMRRDNAFDFAKQEITRSLKSMKPTQRFSILFFGKEVERLEFTPGMPEDYPVPATPENVEKALRWMARCSIQKEGLPPNDALDLAIDMQPDGVFLLFDGDTRVDVPKHLGQSNRSTDILTMGEPRVPIHVVHFFLEEFATSMQRVAAENLGTYRFIPRPERSSASKR